MITVVGSSDLSLTEEMAVRLTSMISTTDQVGVRMTKNGDPASPIERFATALCQSLRKQLLFYGPTLAGRAGVYHRDYSMVRSSTAVFAVFSPDRVMTGGTGHVVKAALDEEVPVEAYTVNEDGSLVMIGSDDGNPYRVHTMSRPDVLANVWEAMHGDGY